MLLTISSASVSHCWVTWSRVHFLCFDCRCCCCCFCFCCCRWYCCCCCCCLFPSAAALSFPLSSSRDMRTTFSNASTIGRKAGSHVSSETLNHFGQCSKAVSMKPLPRTKSTANSAQPWYARRCVEMSRPTGPRWRPTDPCTAAL